MGVGVPVLKISAAARELSNGAVARAHPRIFTRGCTHARMAHVHGPEHERDEPLANAEGGACWQERVPPCCISVIALAIKLFFLPNKARN